MPIFIIDGPEKAGKSTLISRLDGGDVIIRSWGPVDSVLDYIEPLIEDFNYVKDGGTVIWDRSWASEYVYNKLVRNRNTDAYTLDFLEMGPWTQYLVKLMVLPPPRVLAGRRADANDPTDHEISPVDEFYEFRRYAEVYHWQIIRG